MRLIIRNDTIIAMTILQVHKYYFPRDGASKYVLNLSELLQNRGHEVIPFSQRDPNNLLSSYSNFFVSNAELNDPQNVGFFNKIRWTGRMFYSFEAKQNIEKLLETKQIDIVHLHNIYHHISPSILPVIKTRDIPIVMTLHDYKLICPNYTMYHHGAIHEEDATGWYLSCVKNKCHKNSRLQSAIITAEMIWHNKIMRYYERLVDKFIAPSQFIMDKCVEHGWPREKFIHIPHPIKVSTITLSEDMGYVLYIGRLSPEKGLDILVDAAALTPDISYKIVGTGPILTHLQERIQREDLRQIELLGFKTGEELTTLIRQARLLVAPSVWYENYPLSILEAKALGKIVIGSNIGGITELLPRELLARVGDSDSLAELIKKWYYQSFSEQQRMGQQLREEVLNNNNPDRHTRQIIELYQSLVNS